MTVTVTSRRILTWIKIEFYTERLCQLSRFKLQLFRCHNNDATSERSGPWKTILQRLEYLDSILDNRTVS